MKTKFAKLALIAALSVAGATTAFAHEDYTEGGSSHWISHVVVNKSRPAANRIDPYGYATSGTAERVVDVDRTKSLYVTRIETVQINMGGKSVIWTFDTLGTRSFALSKIVPGADGVMVQVDENPMYKGN